ncbi:MAG: OmpA family protein [Sandaracinaceae bacterium]
MAFIVGIAALGLTAPAAAQLERLELRGEALVGGQLADFQRDDLGFEAGVSGALRPGFRIVDMLALQLALGVQLFPGENGAGQLFFAGGGLRFEPRIGDVGRLFVDANANYGLTGDLHRFAIDVGAGFEFDLHPLVGLGPMLRYSHLFAAEGDVPQDASSVWGGVSLVVRLAEEPREGPGADSDGDGVLDGQDLCPQIPAGDSPDPARPGCPLVDRDEDGVSDREDICPDTHQGDNPDPERPGCPEADSDGDGVHDSTDECPSTPQGEHPDPDRPGCPEADTDSDTFVDSEDQCPEVHVGPHPDPERQGCPLPDRDNDMVPDATDACPDRPGAPNEDPELNGCPSLVHIQDGQIHINRPVFFATDSDRILPRSMPVMRALRDAMRASPFIRRISIEGHTDDRGTEEHNLDLSNRRAHSVMTWLVEQGVEPDRLEARGFGEGRPLIPEENRRARAVNRRVEFHILDPAPPERQTARIPGGDSEQTAPSAGAAEGGAR